MRRHPAARAPRLTFKSASSAIKAPHCHAVVVHIAYKSVARDNLTQSVSGKIFALCVTESDLMLCCKATICCFTSSVLKIKFRVVCIYTLKAYMLLRLVPCACRNKVQCLGSLVSVQEFHQVYSLSVFESLV